MAVRVDLTGKLKITLTKTAGGVTAGVPAEFTFSDELTDGTILDKCDLVYFAKAVALTGSATNTLDFAGALSDFYGTTITAVKLKFLYFKNLNLTAGNTITLGGNANEIPIWSASGTETVGPNHTILKWGPSLAGLCTVTATTGDILDIVNDTANAVTYDVAFGGTSA